VYQIIDEAVHDEYDDGVLVTFHYITHTEKFSKNEFRRMFLEAKFAVGTNYIHKIIDKLSDQFGFKTLEPVVSFNHYYQDED
jgi:hypothetical protein